MRRVTQRGLEAIMRHEGVVLTPYRDSANLLRKHGLFWGHPPLDAIEHRHVFDASLLGPLSKRFGNSIDRNSPSSASVTALLFLSSPKTVIGTIVSTYVNTLQTVLRAWARPHVGGEIREISPSGTDLNSAPAIVSVVSSTGIGASLMHTGPDTVFGMPSTPSGMAVLGASSRSRRHPKATAGFGVPRCQRARVESLSGSTIALAKAAGVACGGRLGIGKNSQEAEFQSNHFDFLRHVVSMANPPMVVNV